LQTGKEAATQLGSLVLTASLSTAVNAVKGLTREEMVECLVSPLREPSDFLAAFELAETALFLHRPASKLSPAKRKMLEDEQRTDPSLAGKKVLVIDDDVRNIFSLTSLLERHHMEVLFAENGRDGLELLKNTPDVDAILVDVMMPDIDGYETMREIRKMRKFKSTPMIAVTAKAMKGDRERCLEAGASDYVSKPADIDRLLSLLRIYLGR